MLKKSPAGPRRAPKRSSSSPKQNEAHGLTRRAAQARLVVSTGCPAGIGPEISVATAAAARLSPILVGDLGTLRRAAKLLSVAPERLVRFDPGSNFEASSGVIPVVSPGPRLAAKDRIPGDPSQLAGEAQLAYIEAGYQLTKRFGGALVTAPVSKAAIAHSGRKDAHAFIGHTEWLEMLDGARSSVMCFSADRLTCALVTTHVALAKVPRVITKKSVAEATVRLAEFLLRLGKQKPKVVVCSLNPHAGEGAMFGNEEARAIAPGVEMAKKSLENRAEVLGPIGAETAFRKTFGGEYQGVVAMYHDQATIPMKLVSFGEAVNVTLGLSIDRTSVDHGTAYDIAWQGRASTRGMKSALLLAERLCRARSSRA